jgi:hypothetical protein
MFYDDHIPNPYPPTRIERGQSVVKTGLAISPLCYRPHHHKKILFVEFQKILKMSAAAGDNQCEVVLVGCGAPKRGMGWYHAVQMIKNKCPSAKLCYIVEPWFLGGGEFVFHWFGTVKT